jgi:hypothetical protein
MFLSLAKATPDCYHLLVSGQEMRTVGRQWTATTLIQYRMAYITLVTTAFLQAATLADTLPPNQPIYAKIAIFDKANLYLETVGDELRMAPSVAGLKNAPIVRAITPDFKGQPPIFLNVPLPIPADVCPPHMIGAHATLAVSRYRSERRLPMISGNLITSYVGDDQATWTYQRRFAFSLLDVPTVAEKATVIAVLDEPCPTLRLNAKASQEGAANIEVILTDAIIAATQTRPDSTSDFESLARQGKYGGLLLDTAILRNGTSLEVSVRILNKDGNEVKRDKGPLSTFGFS